MATAAARQRRSERDARAALRERLEARREEIEAAALTRVSAIADPTEISDPVYAEGLRAAVAAAITYGIETTGREQGKAPIPVALLAQARMAARVGIPLDTVLRRYFAGYSLLGYFILEEASNAGMSDGAELKRLLGAHAGLFDRLLAAVGEEYGRESELLAQPTASRRQAERIERLLAGEQLDTSEIPYDFEGWHLGVVAGGPGADASLREVAARLDCRLLLLSDEGGRLWAWLGAGRRLDSAAALEGLDGGYAGGGERPVAIALGESAGGLSGWRLTHRQASAALGVALRGGRSTVRYADVALLASALQDDLLSESLRRLYIEPLEAGRDGGETLRETLRAYFAAGRNGASAALALGVSRQTTVNRLQAIEERVGLPLASVATSLEVALEIHYSGHGPGKP